MKDPAEEEEKIVSALKGLFGSTEDVCTYEGLLSKAEAAMHNAKRSCRNQVSQ